MPAEQPPSAAELARLCVELAVAAGTMARAGRAQGFDIAAKSTPTDVVTAVDRRVERWLVAALAEQRPGDAVLGEEGGGRPGVSGVRWILDPIDGTVNFMLGLPQYAVSVAAEVDGTVLAGCVHNPVSGETFEASLGAGAHLSGGYEPGTVRLAGPRAVPMERAVVGTGFGYAAGRRGRQGQVLARLLPHIGDIRRAGCASLDLCAVAAGRLDAYYEVGLNLWDWAAGLLVAHEAGCRTSGLRGRPASELMTAVAGPGLATEFFGELERLHADVMI